MSKKKKTILILIAFLAFIAIVFVITIVTSTDTEVIEDRGTDQPITVPLPKSRINLDDIPKNADKLVEGDIEIDNFYKSAQVINENGDAVVNKSEDHETIYFPTGSQFLISIIGSPFDEAKLKAEVSFLQSLGISQDEACRLNVIITTPRFANPEQAGQEYKLSFCEQ